MKIFITIIIQRSEDFKMAEKFDFAGWATKNDIRCADGRTIKKDAFKECDNTTVPLVWQHQHDGPDNILGHALLENKENGVYAYCSFNDSPNAEAAKDAVRHGDITHMSIYANKLQQDGGNVLHGVIREVSLVLAGANPGACIEFPVLSHGDDDDIREAIIRTGEDLILSHNDENNNEQKDEDSKMANKTVEDVINTMNEEQQNVLYYLIGVTADREFEEGDDEDMKHNAFENDEMTMDALAHDAMDTIIGDAKKFGSLRESFLAHADDYGIEQIDYLFPDAQNVTNTPQFIQRKTDWVSTFMSKTHHTPFSKIKSLFADITEDDARAKGYIKGNMKKEEVFTLLKRSTSPTTIYKKQKLDRDDIVDITDFDVVSWIKTEMRGMLDEEIARACLVGDGRLSSSDEKINESNIRPIWKDDDFYTIKALVEKETDDTEESVAKKFIKACIKSRKNYKGSGSPTLFTTSDMITECLLIEDGVGRRIYNSINDLATALRVSNIVEVEVMENLKREDAGVTKTLMAIIVNPIDYNIGADMGGAINMFDDFDIDYNQMKYLLETRCSGALVKPYSAIAIESKEA